MASIMTFALRSAGTLHPYYYDVPDEFRFPAMFFPQPEIITRGETFRTYASEYAWHVNIMCETTEAAHEIALKVLTKLKRKRNLVPLINEDGEEIGKKLRLKDPSLKRVDTGAVQLVIEWTSRRPYDLPDVLKMQRFHLNYEDKYEKEVAEDGNEEPES